MLGVLIVQVDRYIIGLLLIWMLLFKKAQVGRVKFEVCYVSVYILMSWLLRSD